MNTLAEPFTTASATRKTGATVGSLFAFVIGFIVLVGVPFAAYTAAGSSDEWKVLVVGIPLLIFELTFLYWLKEALEWPRYPFVPWFALGRRRWPVWCRPFVATWWLAHFAVGLGGAVLIENLIVTGATTWDVRLLRAFALMVVSFTVAYSANLYALLTVTALGGGPKLVNRIWRSRVVLDLALAIVAGVFPIVRPAPAEPLTSGPAYVPRHHWPLSTKPSSG